MDINYFHRQKLSYREIARKTGRDRRTVKKYAEHPELIGAGRAKVEKPSILDPFADVIKAWLEEDDQYQASWVLDRIRKLGYTGGYTIVKDLVRKIKQERSRIAYLRFETEPGKQAQVDFGEFKVVEPDGSERTLYLFSMILGFSRTPYCEFLEKCDMTSFLDAHQRAFAHFGGVCAEILYDRMKNVFIKKLAGRTYFTQSLMSIADHYGFEPKVCPAYSPWIKGKVERPMEFIREGFWRGYCFISLECANRDLMAFIKEKSQRKHGTTGEKVCDMFEREKPFLLPLPPALCDISMRLFRKVQKDCTISVDGSRYEVPHILVGKKIIVRMKNDVLHIYDNDILVATHTISSVKGRLIELPGLREAILKDREMNTRKYGRSRRAKGKATISPVLGKYGIEVERRPLSIYASIGGGVGYV